jgi:branched-chain amino acid transport system permease protein
MEAWFDDLFWTYQNVVVALGVNGILALSMYVVLAAGQLSLGQAAFMGLGAYSSALLSLWYGWPFWVVLPAACVAPVAFALAVGGPTLKLSGVYLAMATIGLGEVLRAVYLNVDALGGALGLSGIPQQASPLLIYAVLAVAIAVLWLVGRSGVGRAMEAMREDDTAALAMGINVRRTRLAVLVASAVLAGLAGALSAHATDFIGPNDFGVEPAVTILSFALLGGVGSPFGPVLGAVVLTVLPELLRGLADLRLVLNGIVIVVAVLFLPRGLLAWRMPRRAA